MASKREGLLICCLLKYRKWQQPPNKASKEKKYASYIYFKHINFIWHMIIHSICMFFFLFCFLQQIIQNKVYWVLSRSFKKGKISFVHTYLQTIYQFCRGSWHIPDEFNLRHSLAAAFNRVELPYFSLLFLIALLLLWNI